MNKRIFAAVLLLCLFVSTASAQSAATVFGWPPADGSVTNAKLAEPISVANGGTGATTAAAGLAALGGASLNGSSTVDFQAKKLTFASTNEGNEKIETNISKKVESIVAGDFCFSQVDCKFDIATDSTVILTIPNGDTFGGFEVEMVTSGVVSLVDGFATKHTWRVINGTPNTVVDVASVTWGVIDTRELITLVDNGSGSVNIVGDTYGGTTPLVGFTSITIKGRHGEISK